MSLKRNDKKRLPKVLLSDPFTTFSGAADTEDALQRRKERYRHELQEQIAEQHRNKKRYIVSDPCIFMYNVTPK